MPTSEPALGDRLLQFLQCGMFERTVTTLRPLGRWRVKLGGGAIISQTGIGDTFEEALKAALDQAG